MKPMATRRLTPTYTRVSDDWHIIRLPCAAFFGRTREEALKKERAWWRTQRRAVARIARRNARFTSDE